MTKEQFEQWYADNSGTPLERLAEIGLSAVACNCGRSSCKGWRMVHWSETVT